MHLDADEEEQQQAAQGDPTAKETWSRQKAEDESTATGSIAGSTAVASEAGTSVAGGTNSDSPLPNPPVEAGKGLEDDAREQHTQHDEAAVGETTGKPHTDAGVAAAAAAAAEERDV